MTRSVGFILLVLGTVLVSSFAFAQHTKGRPSTVGPQARPSARTIKRNMVKMTEHPNNFRYQAIRAAGLEGWRDRQGASVHQVGATRDGMSIVTVRSPKLARMEVVLVRRVLEGNGQYTWHTTKADRLTNRDLRTIGLVAGSQARGRAMRNGGKYRNVRGTIRYAGTSRSGESQKIEVTPATPVRISDRWGTETVHQLTRYIHLSGAETAAATRRDWQSNNPPVLHTRPAIVTAANP